MRRVSFLAALTISVSALAGAQPAPAAHTVVGNVRAADESRLAGAVVEMLPAEAAAAVRRTSTDDAGTFRFAGVSPGVMLLRIRRVGFRPETLQLEVPQIDGGAVVVPLERVAQPLARHVVRSRGSEPDVASPYLAFERRRAAGQGRFVTRADIERRRPQRTSDIFRTVPGVTLVQGPNGTIVPNFRSVMVGRRVCNPFYWVDGSPLGDVPLDLDSFSPNVIEGIEMYSGIATVPGALRSASAGAVCGVVAIWTRHGAPKERAPRAAARDARPPADAASDVERLVAAGDVFTADQVERSAALEAGAEFAPEYPDSLRAVAGRVVAEFVVDSAGAIERATVGFVSSTNGAFADAVRVALDGVRFVPAARAGRPVRQVVQWPVTFEPATGVTSRAPR
jgi:TonB family protein